MNIVEHFISWTGVFVSVTGTQQLERGKGVNIYVQANKQVI